MIERDGNAVVFTGLAPILQEQTQVAAPAPNAAANRLAIANGLPMPREAAISPSEKPLSLKQTISQLKKRLRVVERGIRERAELEREREAINRLIEAAKAPGAELRVLRRAL